MEYLPTSDEQIIAEFHNNLEQIIGPDDMFPPEDGVREPQPRQPNPILPKNQLGELAMCCAVSAI